MSSTRVTLNAGDIWTSEIANLTVAPRIDGGNEWGSIPLVADTNMSSDPTQLKAKTYAFLDRVKITSYTGLVFTYSGGEYLNSDGIVTIVPPGTIAGDPSSTGYIYINASGIVSKANTLPNVNDAICYYESNATDIILFRDTRIQKMGRVSAISDPNIAGFKTGDIKFSLNPSAESGWYVCTGQYLDPLVEPDLFAAIGYKFGQSGSLFRLPGVDNQFTVFATNLLAELANTVGSNNKQITVSNLPSHSHTSNPIPHTHASTPIPHTHTTQETPHIHSTTQTPHAHLLQNHRGATFPGVIPTGSGGNPSTGGVGTNPRTDERTVNIDINPASTGLSIRSAVAPVQLESANASVSIGSTGGDQPFNVQSLGICAYLLIKA